MCGYIFASVDIYTPIITQNLLKMVVIPFVGYIFFFNILSHRDDPGGVPAGAAHYHG